MTEAIVDALAEVTRYLETIGQSSERLGTESIRTYDLHLVDDRHLVPTSDVKTQREQSPTYRPS